MDNLRGIALMIAAMAGFAMEDAFIKASSASMPAGQILLVLGIGGSLVFALMLKARGEPVISKALLNRAVMIRNISEMVAAMFFVTALVLAPISTVAAILQATPLAVTLGAAIFLGAPVGWRRWTAIGVGFVGVLMILRPGTGAFDLGSLLAAIAVVLMAIRDLSTRLVPPEIKSLQLACYGFAACIPAGLILLALFGGANVPDQSAILTVLGALVVGMAGYYAITAAMRVGEIAVVTPFRYTRLIFTMALGVFFFAERPDGWTLAGAALIIGSGLFTILREAHLSQRQRGLPSQPTGR